jgi:hypothetical protein
MHYIRGTLWSAQTAIGIIIILESLSRRIPVKATTCLHGDVMQKAGGARTMAYFGGSDRLFA